MSEKFLLDTNVVSELMRLKPAREVTAFLGHYPANDYYLPDVVIAEIRFGIGLIEESKKRSLFNQILEQNIRPLFEAHIVSADEETWLIWKAMEYEARKKRRTFGQPDLVIAAMGARNDLTVVTRDTEPFIEAGVKVINPWTS